MTAFAFFFIKTQIFLYTENPALCNSVKNKFVYHIFLGFSFGNSPRWHGPPDVRSTGKDNLLKHSERMPNSTQSFPNWGALVMMGTDSWTPGSVQGKPVGGCSSPPGPAFVSSASEIFAELWRHCPKQPWMGLPMRKAADTGLDTEFETFAWQIWKLLLLPWVNMSQWASLPLEENSDPFPWPLSSAWFVPVPFPGLSHTSLASLMTLQPHSPPPNSCSLSISFLSQLRTFAHAVFSFCNTFPPTIAMVDSVIF